MATEPGRPRLGLVLVLAGLVAFSQNVAVALPGQAFAGLALPLSLAYLTARPDDGPVVSAAVICFAAGLHLGQLRRRRIGVIAFNAASGLLCGGAAGLVVAVGQARGIPLAVSLVGAVLADVVINIGLIVPSIALERGTPIRVVLAGVGPTLVPSLAFAGLGVLVGGLLASDGLLAAVLLVGPALMARAVFASTVRLRQAEEATIEAFLAALGAHDLYTELHTRRVARYAEIIGIGLGFRGRALTRLRRAALLHDVGKIAVPTELLNKPGRLTAQEFSEVKRHDIVVIDVLERVAFLDELVGVVAGWKARNAAGEAVGPPPIEERIVHVADAFDAMTSTRSYRKALSMAAALEELHRNVGLQFHGPAVEALAIGLQTHGIEVGAGHEEDAVSFPVEPPTVGFESAGLGHLAPSTGQAPLADSAPAHAADTPHVTDSNELRR